VRGGQDSRCKAWFLQAHGRRDTMPRLPQESEEEGKKCFVH